MTHTNCTHPSSSTARAACRKARKAADLITGATVESCLDTLGPDFRLIKGISFETETCDRCGGTAQMPFAAWGGVCLKCNKSGKGNGQIMTRAGKAARKAYDDYLEKHHTKMMIDLQPGDIVRDLDGRRTVVEVDREIRHGGTCTIGAGDNAVTFSTLHITVRFKNVSYQCGPYSRITVPPVGDAQQAAFRHVANRKGCTAVYVD